MAMQCEDVQAELARDTMTPAVREAVASHVRECATCQSVQFLYARMTEVVAREWRWEPSSAFASAVAARGLEEMPHEQPLRRERILLVVQLGIWGVSAAATAYVGARVFGLVEPVVSSVAANVLTAFLGANEGLARLMTEWLPAPAYVSMWAWVAVSFVLAGLIRPWRNV
jgi:hypothetical protein